jgi:hypothetical protein
MKIRGKKQRQTVSPMPPHALFYLQVTNGTFAASQYFMDGFLSVAMTSRMQKK